MSFSGTVQLNEHAIGILMKEMVRRAIEVIRTNRFVFEVYNKPGYDGVSEDLFTNADEAAQGVYIKLINESFPGFGILAEEACLTIPCEITGRDIYFVVDPLDGTKAFTRRQSHGIGTMIALVNNDEIIASYIGDIMTQEIYGYRPSSKNVYRISEYGIAEKLSVHHQRPLSDQYLLLRDDPRNYSQLIQEISWSKNPNAVFSNIDVGGGSIGISLAQLWKSELGGAVLRPGMVTPWDMGPIIGICQKMGFKFFAIDEKENKLVKARFFPSKEIYSLDYETLIIHESRVNEIIRLL